MSMYEKFSDKARKVMSFARQEAERVNHDHIAPEHILLGLIKEGSGVAANVLENLGVDLEKLRHEVEKLVKPAPDVLTIGQLPFTRRSIKVLESAIDAARTLDHNYVGTEHLLLGMLKLDPGDIAYDVLSRFDISYNSVFSEVQEFLGCEPGSESAKIASQLKPALEPMLKSLKRKFCGLTEVKVLKAFDISLDAVWKEFGTENE